jgi:hypothetical protein
VLEVFETLGHRFFDFEDLEFGIHLDWILIIGY